MPTGLEAPSFAVINGKLYVASECCVDSSATRFNTLQVYDPATNAWTMAAPIPLAVYTAPSGTAVVNGNLYAAAGSAAPGQADIVSTLQIYNSTSDSWTTGAAS